MKNFWLHFAISQAVAVAEIFLSSSTLSPELKAALQAFIDAGKKLTLLIH